VRFALSVLGRPFAPSVANASDGVGSLFPDLTHTSLVYRKRPLTVSPASGSAEVGSRLTFTAAPTDGMGARGGPYVWSVNDIDGGSAAFGTVTPGETPLSATFQAPASAPSPATVRVCVHRTTLVDGVVISLADKGCASLAVFGNFVGDWSGTIRYLELTPQPVTLNVTSQTGSSASGELFVATAENPIPYNSTSHFTGTVDGNILSFTMPQFVENGGGAVVSLTISGTRPNESLTGTMAELFSGALGRTFSASLSRVPIIGLRAPVSKPSLSVSASPKASLSTSASGSAFGVRTP
jgi:hypothetical protein